jgi:acetoin utilization deacetylase AcuC-like enzyme
VTRLVYSENLYELKLPPAHRFPIGKYRRIYDALAIDHGERLALAPAAGTDDLTLVHHAAYVAAVRNGALPDVAVRRLGFPWSEALADRSRRSVGGTLAALAWAYGEGAAGHLAGGTHHAFADRGEGFCVFNDLAVATRVAQRDHGARRVAIVDLDVHQGNGTAALFAGDPQVLTLSLHGQKNYPFVKEPSSLDVGLPDGCEDEAYLAALDPSLERVEGFRPDLLLYQAGVDPLRGDRFGRLALSHEGLKRRDARVFALARKLGVPLVVVLGGGYHPDGQASVAAHVNVFKGLLAATGAAGRACP